MRLVTERGRLTLLSEDPGGEPLLRLMGHPWEIASFLRFAIGLAAALARFHDRGLIHKDLKPANILVNNATWAVWLTGFGIASHLPRERQAPGSTEAIAGTLPYMAPEQTGRMNRSIDFAQRPLCLRPHPLRDDHGIASILRIRSAGMDPLPHRPPTDPAK